MAQWSLVPAISSSPCECLHRLLKYLHGMAAGFPQSKGFNRTRWRLQGLILLVPGSHSRSLSLLLCSIWHILYSVWEETTKGVNIRRQEANYHSDPLGLNHARPYHLQKYTHPFPRSPKVYSVRTSAQSPESYHLKQVQMWLQLLKCSFTHAVQ